MSNYFKICIIYLTLCVLSFKGVTSSSLLDYVWSVGQWMQSKDEIDSDNLIEQSVPYELSIPDEKFISEATALTGITESGLDMCQQRVVYRLQTKCNAMNDEQVAKLAVMLLNCQSVAENRPTYQCTEAMSLADCTKNMDGDVWNAYHLMTNRARAVCYSVRQTQFRGLTELTVNKLMSTARNQLKVLTELSDGQARLEDAALQTVHSIEDGHKTLKAQQQDLQQAQLHSQLSLEQNIQRLAQEKALIKAGHEQLAKMTKEMKDKLDAASEQIDDQSKEQRVNHRQVLEDLMMIQEQAQDIWKRIEESSNNMLRQSAEASRQYREMLAQLRQVNTTVYSLVELVTASKAAIDERLAWLSESLGGTGNTVDKVYLCLGHLAFLLVTMLACAFLSAPLAIRCAVVAIIPLNLILGIQQGPGNSFDFVSLAGAIVSLTAAHLIFCRLYSILNKSSQSPKFLTGKKLNTDDSTPLSASSPLNNVNDTSYAAVSNKYNVYSYDDVTTKHVSSSNLYEESIREEDDKVSLRDDEQFATPTPPQSRNGYYSPSPRSRSNTPLLKNGLYKRNCMALTRTGNACKLSAVVGRDFCRRHQHGNSIME